MESLWLEMTGVIVLIALMGILSAGEVAVLSARKSRMRELADRGAKHAATVVNFQEHLEHTLAVIHVGFVLSLTLLAVLAGAIGLERVAPWFEASGSRWVSQSSAWLAFCVLVMIVASIAVVFGSLIPKSLALRNPEKTALRVAGALRVCAVAFRVPARILVFGNRVLTRAMSHPAGSGQLKLSEEELKLLLDEGARTGVIDKTEHDLIASVFEFTDTTAKEVMIPRPDVVALTIDMTRDQIVKAVLEEGYSRMPVYRDSIDNIVGIVYTKDLLGIMEFRDLIILQDIIRPAYFVPETMKISRLMRELQERRMHMAVVIDEFGGTEGIITMEDILEEIVGEIHDEYDEELKDVEQAADGSFVVNARVSVSDFNSRFQADLPETEEYETLSGFLSKITGRIPDLGEEIEHGKLEFTIVKKSQRRVRMVKVKRLVGPDRSGPIPHTGQQTRSS